MHGPCTRRSKLTRSLINKFCGVETIQKPALKPGTTVINTLPVTINVAGSYQLGETVIFLDIDAKNIITILSDNVEIDLNYTVLDMKGSGNTGILLNRVKNVTIKNGIIKNSSSSGLIPPDHFRCLMV